VNGKISKRLPYGNISLDGTNERRYYSRSGILIRRSALLERIRSTVDIGKAVRKKRKEDGLTLAEASALCGVGYRFLSNLENGKATAEVGKTLQVLSGLGLELRMGPKGWPDA